MPCLHPIKSPSQYLLWADARAADRLAHQMTNLHGGQEMERRTVELQTENECLRRIGTPAHAALPLAGGHLLQEWAPCAWRPCSASQTVSAVSFRAAEGPARRGCASMQCFFTGQDW